MEIKMEKQAAETEAVISMTVPETAKDLIKNRKAEQKCLKACLET